jgi:hypothetical protein
LGRAEQSLNFIQHSLPQPQFPLNEHLRPARDQRKAKPSPDPSAQFISMKYVFLFALALCLSCTQQQPVTNGLQYALNIQKGFRNGGPERTSDLTLELQKTSDSTIEVLQQGRPDITIRIYDKGVSYDDTLPPNYNALLIASLIPKAGIPANTGSTWMHYFPMDQDLALEAARFSMQDRYTMQYTGDSNNLKKITVRGEVRVLPNQFTSGLFSDPAMASKYRFVMDYQWFLMGTALYDAGRKAVTRFEAYYLLYPQVLKNEDSLRFNKDVQHIVMTLK